MNGRRSLAMWLGIAGVAAGVIAVIAAAMGDLRVGTIVIGQSRELGIGIWMVAVALVVLAVGAVIAPYRPLAAAGLMVVGVLGVLAPQLGETSQWVTDLWTSGRGLMVAYVDENGLANTPGFWDVFLGSATMLGYAGTLILGVAGAIVAAITPRTEIAAVRQATRQASL